MNKTHEHLIGEAILELVKNDQALHHRFDDCEKMHLVTTSKKSGAHFSQSSVRRFDADKLAEGLAVALPKMIAEVEKALSHIRSNPGTGYPTEIPAPDK